MADEVNLGTLVAHIALDSSDLKEGAGQQAEKRRRNEERKQYERIRAALPDTAPKSYAGFVHMKHTNSQKYQELMEDYRYITRVAKQQESGIIAWRDSDSLYHGITEKAINSVPELQLFGNQKLDYAHQEASKNLLREIAKHNNLEVGTEFSIVYDKNMERIPNHDYVQGGLGYVPIDNPDVPYHAFHNHGSGETLSFTDLLGFVNRNNMLSLTAQGNTGSKYVIFSTAQSDKRGFKDFLNAVSSDTIFEAGKQKYSLDKITPIAIKTKKL